MNDLKTQYHVQMDAFSNREPVLVAATNAVADILDDDHFQDCLDPSRDLSVFRLISLTFDIAEQYRVMLNQGQTLRTAAVNILRLLCDDLPGFQEAFRRITRRSMYVDHFAEGLDKAIHGYVEEASQSTESAIVGQIERLERSLRRHTCDQPLASSQFSTVKSLRHHLRYLDDDLSIQCTVVGNDGSAWHCYGTFYPTVGKRRMANIVLGHEQLTTLPSIPNHEHHDELKRHYHTTNSGALTFGVRGVDLIDYTHVQVQDGPRYRLQEGEEDVVRTVFPGDVLSHPNGYTFVCVNQDLYLAHSDTLTTDVLDLQDALGLLMAFDPKARIRVGYDNSAFNSNIVRESFTLEVADL